MSSRRMVLSVEQAAAYLGISRGLAYQAVRDQRLPSIRIGKRLLIPRAALERLLEKAGEGEPLLARSATHAGV